MTVEKTRIEEQLLEVVRNLTTGRRMAVLDFALFLKSQEAFQQTNITAQSVQRLEDLYGDFWPEDESVDDFINAVRQWRDEDADLHRDLT